MGTKLAEPRYTLKRVRAHSPIVIRRLTGKRLQRQEYSVEIESQGETNIRNGRRTKHQIKTRKKNPALKRLVSMLFNLAAYITLLGQTSVTYFPLCLD